MAPKCVLVSGATGRQGKALIQALRPGLDSEANFHILALTRKASTANAKALASESHVTLVEGNLDSIVSMRKIFEDARSGPWGGIWGVFCILAFPGLGVNADGEEKQGKTLADLALEFGVSSFVFSSVERGNDKNDDNLVLDRLAKAKIERHIRFLGSKGLPWTILRPGFFMENFDGTIGSITVAVLKYGLKPKTGLQVIAVDDVGHVAAAVLQDPPSYSSQVLTVVVEILTISELEAAYKEATGRLIPSAPGLIARGLIAMNGHTQELIKDIERIHQERVDGENPMEKVYMAAARAAYPSMRSFRAWAVGKKGKRDKNWNQTTIVGLALGKH